MKIKTRRWIWAVASVLAVAALTGGGVYLWTRPVVRVEVRGASHALPGELVRLVDVRVGERLYGLNPERLADRVMRHPWVRTADVLRLPNGVVRIAVEERTPVALVYEGNRPAAYLDAAGYAMPVLRVEPYDVPLVRGRILPANLTQPAPLVPVRDLAASLATLSPDANALVSDLLVDARGDVTLRTVAAPGGDPLRVRLGRGDYDAKFDALVRFWHRAVLTRPTRRFDVVDLRFAGQIVTREAERGTPFPDSLRADSAAVALPSTPPLSSP
ncbi:MAG: FtsQ-type POTRA domain-containing protein [Rhodothermales bacterium]|nr:FtsQ-type POTRA domain-containing protein [Rhodothermales bacterium]MCA0269136.1 FtsQ-type POTRA domain-containing protein [Bacteroidota bacterium]